MIVVQLRPAPRCWVLGRRIHHGLVGVGLVLVGVGLAWQDRRDYPWPFQDVKEH